MRIALLWMLSLAIVAVLASALTAAQIRRTEPRIYSGADIGFRVEGTTMSGDPAGEVVVRIDGEWVPVGYAGGPRLLSTR